MKNTTLLSEERIVNHIYFIRGKKVMLDRDLAAMYGVATGHLNQAVKRNFRRFPDDFMFQLTSLEWENLISQIVISNPHQKKHSEQHLIFQNGISNEEDSGQSKRGGVRKLPYVFTEQGVAMLSSVLNSDTAIDVNIQIIRVFTRMREVLISQKDIFLKLEKLEKKIMEQNELTGRHEEKIQKIFAALKRLTMVEYGPRKKVGYKRKNED
jgi:phage regulator Rha-like protein